MRGRHRRKSINDREREARIGQSPKILTDFIAAIQIFYGVISPQQGSQKNESQLSTDLIFQAFKKYSSCDPISLTKRTAVLWIRDIVVQIRILFRGSVLLTYRFGTVPGSCFFLLVAGKIPTKKRAFSNFFAYYFLKVHSTSVYIDKK
jgi:hypothetical protein